MGSQSNLKVFIFLRVIEGLISLFCGICHIFGFADPNEPTTHQAIFLIPFFGFIFVSMFGVYKLSKGISSLKLEAACSSVGFISFNFTSIMSMVNIENDKHLWNMLDREEIAHPYFLFNRCQSIASLVNALLLLMHLIFIIDFIMFQPDDLSMASVNDEDEFKSCNPMRLFFFPVKIWITVKKQFKELRKCFKK